MKRYLLDSSFVIDLFGEWADRQSGPARAWLARHAHAEMWISPVTYAEVLEGASDLDFARETLRTFRWRPIARQAAERAALNQRREAQRLSENDAWQVGVADCMEAVIVGHDPAAFARLGARYEDHRAG